MNANDIEVSSYSQTVDAKEALEWILDCPYANQRAVSQPWVDTLAGMMRRQHFRSDTTIVFAQVAQDFFLVNGHHTLLAVVQSQVPQNLLIVTNECQTMEEVNELYMRHDANRNRGTQAGYKAMNFSRDSGLRQGEIAQFDAALSFLYGQFRGGRARMGVLVDASVKIAFMKEWLKEMVMFREAIAGCKAAMFAKIKGRTTLSVALVTLRYQPKKASDFWRDISKDDGLAANDIRKTLAYWLLDPRNSPVSLGATQHARTVAWCWNKFYCGQIKVKHVKIPELAGPVLIEGSPHDTGAAFSYLEEDGTPLQQPHVQLSHTQKG